MLAKLRAFTLLEVLVAVAILGLGLTTILSAQFSAVRTASHARNMNGAVGLARCKMSEIEDDLRVDGLPELDQDDSGPCCGDDETSGMLCSWSITKPTFPEASAELDLDAKIESSPLASIKEKGGDLSDGASLSAVTETLSGGSDGAAGGVGGIASVMMGMVYPALKDIMEASTRRITVVVSWREGSKDYELPIIQWVTQPQQGVLEQAELQQQLQDAATGSGAGSGNSSGNSQGSGAGAGSNKSGGSRTGGPSTGLPMGDR